MRMAARCSWMKSANCRCRCRASCCAFWRTAASVPSAPSAKCRSIFAFIFATNADLQKEVEKGAFAPTCIYRLNVMQIHLPLLKDRGDDVQELATIFMTKLSTQLGMPPVADRQPGARRSGELRLARAMCARLRNLIERTLILGAFPDDFAGPRSDGQPVTADSLADMERRHILCGAEGDRRQPRGSGAAGSGSRARPSTANCALWNV